MKSELTGLVAAVRDSISACVIHILLVDCNDSKQVRRVCEPWRLLAMLAVRVCLLWLAEPYWASAGGCWGTRQGHHFLDGQAELEPVQRVADANLPLNLCVWQICHDSAALYIGTARCHVPRRHPDPQLQTKKKKLVNYKSKLMAKQLEIHAGRTSSHVTTVGPSHDAKGRPWRHASSNKSCLTKQKRDFRVELGSKNCSSVRAGAFMLKNVLAVKCQKLRWDIMKSLALSHFFLLRRSFSTVPVPSLVSPNGSPEPSSSEGVEAGEVRRCR